MNEINVEKKKDRGKRKIILYAEWFVLITCAFKKKKKQYYYGFYYIRRNATISFSATHFLLLFFS